MPDLFSDLEAAVVETLPWVHSPGSDHGVVEELRLVDEGVLALRLRGGREIEVLGGCRGGNPVTAVVSSVIGAKVHDETEVAGVRIYRLIPDCPASLEPRRTRALFSSSAVFVVEGRPDAPSDVVAGNPAALARLPDLEIVIHESNRKAAAVSTEAGLTVVTTLREVRFAEFTGIGHTLAASFGMGRADYDLMSRTRWRGLRASWRPIDETEYVYSVAREPACASLIAVWRPRPSGVAGVTILSPPDVGDRGTGLPAPIPENEIGDGETMLVASWGRQVAPSSRGRPFLTTNPELTVISVTREATGRIKFASSGPIVGWSYAGPHPPISGDAVTAVSEEFPCVASVSKVAGSATCHLAVPDATLFAAGASVATDAVEDVLKLAEKMFGEGVLCASDAVAAADALLAAATAAGV